MCTYITLLIHLFIYLSMNLTVLHSLRCILLASNIHFVYFQSQQKCYMMLRNKMIYWYISPVLPLHQISSKGPDTLSSRHPGDEEEEREVGRDREKERERRWGKAKFHPASAAARWAPTWLPPLGPTEQHTTAGTATFITYRLFPSNSNYQSFTDRQEHTVKLRCVSQQYDK